MKLKQFFTDDDAVSPVIGVILMVAITVILAAVIAAFVLGLGQSTGTQAPQASFSWDYESSSPPTMTISLDSANEDLDSDELLIRGDVNGDDADGEIDRSWTDIAGYGSGTDVTAGDSITFSTNSGSDQINTKYDLKLIWVPSEGGQSSTLSSDTGPDA